MTISQTREIDRITAVSDSGRAYVVVVLQEFIERTPIGRPREWLPGIKSYELESGMPVNFVDDDTFRIVQTDEVIKKVS